jgi:cytochrome b involved in lipid metabolism
MVIYVCIDNYWFDLTNFTEHPGGLSILRKYHLKDASDAFNEIKGHHDEYCYNLMKKYEIKDKDILKTLGLFLI